MYTLRTCLVSGVDTGRAPRWSAGPGRYTPPTGASGPRRTASYTETETRAQGQGTGVEYRFRVRVQGTG